MWLVRRRVDRRIIGEIDHVLADGDQIAADREIVDGAAVIFGIDDCRRFGGKPRQILVDREAGDIEISRQERLQRHRRRQLVGAHQSAGQVVDALMDRLEEVLRLEKIGDAVERLVIDEDRAEQRLLGLDIMRRGAERRFRRDRDLLACCRIECCAMIPIKRFACGRFAVGRIGSAILRALNIADHSTMRSSPACSLRHVTRNRREGRGAQLRTRFR